MRAPRVDRGRPRSSRFWPLALGLVVIGLAVAALATITGTASAREPRTAALALTAAADGARLGASPGPPVHVTVRPNGLGTVRTDPPAFDTARQEMVEECSSETEDDKRCVFEYPLGTTVQFSAVAAKRFGVWRRFVGWGRPDECPGTARCELTVERDLSLSATFTPMTLQVTAEGADGVVTSSPRGEPPLNCAPGQEDGCSASYPAGAAVTLIATSPNPILWSRLCGPPGVGANRCTVTMTHTRVQVGTRFGGGTVSEPGPGDEFATIEVVKAGNGAGTVIGDKVNCGPECTGSYRYGDRERLTARPDPDSIFVGWGEVCRGPGPCEVIAGVTNSVRALFEPNPTEPGPAARPADKHSLTIRARGISLRRKAGRWRLVVGVELSERAFVRLRLQRGDTRVFRRGEVLDAGVSVMRFVLPKRIRKGTLTLHLRADNFKGEIRSVSAQVKLKAAARGR